MLTRIREFVAARDGNILPIFALSLIPIIGLIGAAVDYSRANAVKSQLQAALDATALAMASEAATAGSDQLQKDAQAYFNALFSKYQTTPVTLNVAYSTQGGSQLTVSGSTNVSTTFMRIPGFGIDTLAVGSSSTVAWGNTRLRVALALDNTGSMAQNNKMNSLKTAAKNLIDQISAAANSPDDAYVSIIPFAVDVKLGTSYKNATWLRWSGGSPSSDSWVAKNPSYGSCSISWYTNASDCTSHGSCSRSQYSSQSQCSQHNGTWTAGVWTPTKSQWTGCVMDRDQSYDIANTAPSTSNPSTLFPADGPNSSSGYGYGNNDNCGDDLATIMPLSNNWSALKSKIDSMQPDGNTNTTIGLEWAWHSLSQGDPLNAPAEDPNYQYEKVIIFLTDGENTQNRFTSNPSQIDARMTAACTNAKAAGISIYTILVLDGSPSLLQGCASDPSQYFKITSSSQLVDVFNQIGTSLSQLRVAK